MPPGRPLRLPRAIRRDRDPLVDLGRRAKAAGRVLAALLVGGPGRRPAHGRRPDRGAGRRGSWPPTPPTWPGPPTPGPTPPRSTGCGSTPAGSPAWPPACGTWPACPTRWARSSRAGSGPTACGSSGSGSRSGSSASSTRTARTSPATPPGCASSRATPSCCGARRRAISSNLVIAAALRDGLAKAGLPVDAVGLVEDTSRASAVAFMQLDGVIDCLIPRGGASLIASIQEHATVPYVIDGIGNCHVYVDAAADLDMAESIVVNAKTQRPGVCNAAESLVVHRAVADAFLPRIAARPRRGHPAGRRGHPGRPARHRGGHRGGLRRRVPRADPVRRHRRRPRRRHRPHHPLRVGPLRGHRHPGHRRGRPVHRRGGRRRRGRQRLDPLRRRRRARTRRRDRHLHPEAPRPGPDGPPRAHLDPIRRHRNRPGTYMSQRQPHPPAGPAPRRSPPGSPRPGPPRFDVDRRGAHRAGRGGLPGRRRDLRRRLPGRPAGQAGPGRGSGRHRQDRAGQVGGPPDRQPADPPPVLRGARRVEGPLRVELQEAAAAHPGRLGPVVAGAGGRHLQRGVPPHPARCSRPSSRPSRWCC